MKRALATAAALGLCAALALGQEAREPRAGYLYPAGGQRGAVVQVLCGGQALAGARDVYVTGSGVRATVVRAMGRIVRLNGEERREVARRLRALAGDDGDGAATRMEASAQGESAKAQKDGAASAPEVKLPRHPLLDDLEHLNAFERDFVVHELLQPDPRRQPNSPLSESVLLEVTIDPDAAPGVRELRLATRAGLTNPVRFEVGSAPELLEPEPYDPGAKAAPAADPPVVLNGQIRPGDVDRFQVRAAAGEELRLALHARRLTPFLADAVPGWFQATLAVYDPRGQRVAFSDDDGFDPDPALRVKVREAGDYVVEVRDALDRGREDFVYRLSVGAAPAEAPRAPAPASAAADALPQRDEVEPNDAPAQVQRVEIPVTLSGCVGAPGDRDVFQLRGRAGQELVCEVVARRTGSPLDSLLRLSDADGAVLAWNDDFEHKDGVLRTDVGELTHHADSYLRATLPRDGVYRVEVGDAQQHGGPAYTYRLRVGPPRPDFLVALTPASVNLRGGSATVVTAHALRLDGFAGDIDLALVGAPAGFALQGARIPAGCDAVRLTVSAPADAQQEPVVLRVEARARVGPGAVVRAAVPCDDAMQAFLWRHLVPSREWVVAVVSAPGRRALSEVGGALPVVVPRGGTVEVPVRTWVRADSVQLELDDPPPGLALREVLQARDGFRLVLGADAGAVAGLAGNLIVAAYTETTPRDRDGKPNGAKRRSRAGVLPAIPFRVDG